MFRRLLIAAVVAVVLGTAGCGGSEAESGTPSRYSGLIAASEFVVGPNRFPFGLVSRDGEFLEEAAVRVRFFSLSGTERELHAEEEATWRTIQGTTPHVHPDGELHLHLDFQGVYVVDEVVFPEAGVWVAEFTARKGRDARPTVEKAAFRVLAEAVAPGVGERVPATENPTIHDVASFAELSTRAVEDQLHNVSVAQALDAAEPFVVFFASPRFCVSAMCGPVTETLDRVRGQLGGAVEFIHIEPWDLAAARNEGRLVPAEVMSEWALPTEPWTFVVGADGRVAARFEGLVTEEEVLAVLRPLR